MYDLHVHILPGIDDGPETLEESFQMGKIASDSGTQILVATPHRKDVKELHSLDKIEALTKTLNNLFAKNNIEIKLLLGMENHMSSDLVDDYLNGFAITINKSRYMLLEMPFFGSPNYVFSVINEFGFSRCDERFEKFIKSIGFLQKLCEVSFFSLLAINEENAAILIFSSSNSECVSILW